MLSEIMRELGFTRLAFNRTIALRFFAKKKDKKNRAFLYLETFAIRRNLPYRGFPSLHMRASKTHSPRAMLAPGTFPTRNAII